jgi:uncharacterized LabA/DUF88 family protein
MIRFALFVDGSNLYGSLRSMNLEVSDYEKFFAHVHDEACNAWLKLTRTSGGPHATTHLRRVYWYTVGSIDDWDLSLPQSRAALRKSFQKDRDVHDSWMARVGANERMKGEALEERAWAACFADFTEWYERKCDVLDGMRRFQQSIRASTDIIDVIAAGHWKVNFLHKSVEEKGLDTSLAVDLLALEQNYDVAVVVSGDADGIPSIIRMKERGKQVASVEFVGGAPSDDKGRGFSSRLKLHSDYVIRLYETDLLKAKHAQRPAANFKPSA